MRLRIKSADLSGNMRAIPSKSAAHRILIAAALADRPTDIALPLSSRDIDATAECLGTLGSDISPSAEEGALRVVPLDRERIPDGAVLDVGESGSTLRFMLPVAAALGAECRIIMHGRLPGRPLSPLWEELMAHGAVLRHEDAGSIVIGGRLRDPHFTIAADISSQFISGLLLAIPLMGPEGSVTLTGEIESGAYIEMTIEALSLFGVKVMWEVSGDAAILRVCGGYRSPGSLTVEGDWSNGAFWLTAGALTGGRVRVSGLNPRSIQGDRAVVGFIRDIAAGGAVIDARDTPDLVPVLSVLAAVSPGTTRFTHAGRLRLKESDRIRSTVDMIRGLGGEAEESADGLTVTGVRHLRGGLIDSAGDHRIAMSAAIAAIVSDGDVMIDGAEAVAKSYPRFWEDFAQLGGVIESEG